MGVPVDNGPRPDTSVIDLGDGTDIGVGPADRPGGGVLDSAVRCPPAMATAS